MSIWHTSYCQRCPQCFRSSVAVDVPERMHTVDHTIMHVDVHIHRHICLYILYIDLFIYLYTHMYIHTHTPAHTHTHDSVRMCLGICASMYVDAPLLYLRCVCTCMPPPARPLSLSL